MTLLVAEMLRIEAGGREVVSGLDLSIGVGEALALVGPSGSGKSMTAAALAGILPPGATVTAGRLRFDGRALRGPADWDPLRGRRIGMVFQHPRRSLNPIRTIGDQIADVLARHKAGTAAEVREAVAEVMTQVRLPDRFARMFPHELSGGLCQRAAIAAALAGAPDLLIADEPTTDLDTPTQAAILDLLAELGQSRGMALLLITHDLAVAARCCARLAVMAKGRLVEQGPVAALLAAPKTALTRQLRDAARPRVAEPSAGPGTEVLRAEGLRRAFRSARSGWRTARIAAVEGASLTLSAGESVGLIGASGSGKTTLARMICRLEPPDAGRLLIGGEDALAVPLRRFARHPLRIAVQIAFQDATGALPPRMTAFAAIADPLRQLRPGLTEVELTARIRQAAALAGLPEELLHRRPPALSGGERARVGLARALAPEPRAVVLDEPTSALDATLRAELLDRLDALRRETGLALLFISHDLAAVSRLCDRALVMDAGRIVEEGPVSRLLTSPTHECTRALVAAMPVL